MMHLVEQILEVERFTLRLLFNTGEAMEIDLREKLLEWGGSPDSIFFDLRDEALFAQARLDREAATVVWPNGADLCPDVLHSLGKPMSLANSTRRSA